jgi:DNA ligase (NAD+)
LTEEDIASLPRMGEKSAKRALKTLHDGKEITLEQFVGGLSIHMVGETITGLLMDAGYTTINKIRNCSHDDFAEVPGIGPGKAYSLYQGLKINNKLIDELLKHVTIKNRQGNLINYSIAITGPTKMKRSELQTFITDNGGSYKSSVSKTCTHLIINDLDSVSSKAKSAKKLGIKLITEEYLLNMVICAMIIIKL